jgi:hypothetical protein
MPFELGQTVVTAAALDALGWQDGEEFPAAVKQMLDRHASHDWGDLGVHDCRMNDAAVRRGDDRVLSRYNLDAGAFYVITEWDRSVTTVLRVQDY